METVPNEESENYSGFRLDYFEAEVLSRAIRFWMLSVPAIVEEEGIEVDEWAVLETQFIASGLIERLDAEAEPIVSNPADVYLSVLALQRLVHFCNWAEQTGSIDNVSGFIGLDETDADLFRGIHDSAKEMSDDIADLVSA